MQATITYRFDLAGQRASLAAGGNGQAEQTATVEIQASDLDLFAVAHDGTLSAEAQCGASGKYGWDSHYFPNVPSPADLIVFLRERQAARAIVEAARKQKAADDAAAEKLARDQRIDGMVEQLRAALAEPGKVIEIATMLQESGRAAEMIAEMRARSKAAEEQKLAREARMKTINAIAHKAKLRPVTVQPDGSYFFDVPTPANCDWAKRVDSIDSAAKNGYAFVGEWLPKPGNPAILQPGDLLLVGGKNWEGSRKRGEWVHYKTLYVVTPAGILVIEGNARNGAVEYLALSPAERIENKMNAAKKRAVENIADFEALDRVEFAGELPEIDERLASWRTRRDLCAKALEAPSPDEQIADIDSAASAIVGAGYKALAKLHHPDTGGNEATMALLTAARTQLRDLLKLAAAGGAR